MVKFEYEGFSIASQKGIVEFRVTEREREITGKRGKGTRIEYSVIARISLFEKGSESHYFG